jgi:hypothetical protein
MLLFAALALLQFAAITLYMPFMLLQPLCLHVCSVCRLQRLRSIHVYNAYKNASAGCCNSSASSFVVAAQAQQRRR